MTDKKAETSKAAKAAKASSDKAAAAQAKADEKASMKAGATVTVKAADAAPCNLAELDKPQIQLGQKVNAVRIQPTGVPQTVYVAGLRNGKWCHVAKCGVPANAPGVVKMPGALAFSKKGGGDIVLVACKL